MAALLGRLGLAGGGARGAAELALDFSAAAITLYERTPAGGWQKFASTDLSDPEFPVIIALLRTEAETRARHDRPVRLWLPADQILHLTAAIGPGDEAARRAAAFKLVAAQGRYRPQDLAIAVSPPDRQGNATVLATFAETWREARQYASRWGFVPGAVSTRHHAGAFGRDGPELRLLREPARAGQPPSRPSTWLGALLPSRTLSGRQAAIGLGAAAVFATAAVLWGAGPWHRPVGPTSGEAARAAPVSGDESGDPPGSAPMPLSMPGDLAAAGSAAGVASRAADAGPAAAPIRPLTPAATLPATPASVRPPAPSLPEPLRAGGPPALAALDAAKTDGAEAALIRRPQATAVAPGLLLPASLKPPAAVARAPGLPGRFERDPVRVAASPAAQPDGSGWIAAFGPAQDPTGLSSPARAAGAPPLLRAALPRSVPVVAVGPALPVLAAEPAIPEQALLPTATPAVPNNPEADAAPPLPSVPATLVPPLAAAGAGDPVAADAATRPIDGPVPLPRARPARGAAGASDALPAAPADSQGAGAAGAGDTDATGAATPVTPSDPSSPLTRRVLPRPRPAGLSGTVTGGSAVSGTERVWRHASDPAGTSGPGVSWPTTVATDPGTGLRAGKGGDPATPAGPDPSGSRVAAIMAPKPPVRPDRTGRSGSPAPASASSVLPKITPAVPGTVRATATEPGIPLNQTSLVGIVHVDGASKALVRLPDGRYRSVVVGDVIEGWRISGIGTDAMRMSRSGEERTLMLVSR